MLLKVWLLYPSANGATLFVGSPADSWKTRNSLQLFFFGQPGSAIGFPPSLFFGTSKSVSFNGTTGELSSDPRPPQGLPVAGAWRAWGLLARKWAAKAIERFREHRPAVIKEADVSLNAKPPEIIGWPWALFAFAIACSVCSTQRFVFFWSGGGAEGPKNQQVGVFKRNPLQKEKL